MFAQLKRRAQTKKSLRARLSCGSAHLKVSLSFLVILPSLACGPETDLVSLDNPSIYQPLDYQPHLGVGVNFAETKTYRRCVTTPMMTVSHAFKDRLYDEIAVKNRSELNAALSIDASVSAKGVWGGASSSGVYFNNIKMSSDAFYWLVNAEYRLMDEGIDTGDSTFTLTDEAKRILNGPGGLAAFYRACGHQFYSGSTKGAHYALLYEFKSHEQKTIERIKSQASYSGWGVQAKASFEKFSEMAMRSSVLKVHSMTEGGSDRLKSYATSPDALEEELSKLRDDLYHRGQGIEVHWYVSDYAMFAEVAEAKARVQAEGQTEPLQADKVLKDNALGIMYGRYMRNVDLQQHLSRKLEGASGPEPLYAFDAQRKDIFTRI